MLQGTLDVFTIDEVLGLLSTASKSGVLRIDGDRGTGALQVADGQLVAGSADLNAGGDTVEAVAFELLRFASGSFAFDADATLDAPAGAPVSVHQCLASAHDRLREWRSIEAVVPSLDHRLSVIPALETDDVTLSKTEWTTIVAVGEGASVGVVAERLGLGEVDGSRHIKGLVERGLVSLTAPSLGVPAGAMAADNKAASIAGSAAPSTPASTLGTSAVSGAAPASVSPATSPSSAGAAPISASPVGASPTAASSPAASSPAASSPAPSSTAASSSSVDPLSPLTDLADFASAEVDSQMGFDDTDLPPMPTPPPGLPSASDSFSAQIAEMEVPSTEAVSDDEQGTSSLTDAFAEDTGAVAEASDAFADAGEPVVETGSDMPPSPSEIDAFANTIEDAASLNAKEAAVGVADDAAADAAESMSADDRGNDDNGSDDTGNEEGSLLMRYLRSNG